MTNAPHPLDLRAHAVGLFSVESSRQRPLDGLRALALVAVVMTHATGLAILHHPDQAMAWMQSFGPGTQWFLAGDKAVDCFFVISGLLIGGMVLRERERTGRLDVRRFLTRRLLRLAPPYYFVIAVFAVGATVMGADVWVPALLANVLYVDTFMPIAHRYLGFSWSLAIEEQFYVLWALCAAYVLPWVRRPLVFLGGLFVVSCAVRLGMVLGDPALSVPVDLILQADKEPYALNYFSRLYGNLYTRFGAIVVGLFCAYLVAGHKPLLERLRSPLWGSGLVVVSSLWIWGSMAMPVYDSTEPNLPLQIFFHTLHRNIFSAGIAGLIVAMLNPGGLARPLSRVLSWRGFYVLAQLSYAAYLTHLPPLAMTYRFGSEAGLLHGLSMGMIALHTLLAMPVVLLFAFILTVAVERPFLAWRDRRVTKA